MKTIRSISAIALLTILLSVSGTLGTFKVSSLPEESTEQFRVLVKFKDGLLSPATFEHSIGEIMSTEIRNMFTAYGVTEVHEAFKNRYDSNGKLKANPARPYTLLGWQEVAF